MADFKMKTLKALVTRGEKPQEEEAEVHEYSADKSLAVVKFSNLDMFLTKPPYAVLHVRTGMALAHSFRRADDAREAMERIEDLNLKMDRGEFGEGFVSETDRRWWRRHRDKVYEAATGNREAA